MSKIAKRNGENEIGTLADFLNDGFSESRIVKVGLKDGQIPFYVGMLIGPGAPIEVVEDSTGEVAQIPTWVFKPLLDSNGKVRENVTDVMMTSHQLNGECARIFAQCERTGRKALVAIQADGQVDTRKGRRVNAYRVAEKFV